MAQGSAAVPTGSPEAAGGSNAAVTPSLLMAQHEALRKGCTQTHGSQTDTPSLLLSMDTFLLKIIADRDQAHVNLDKIRRNN